MINLIFLSLWMTIASCAQNEIKSDCDSRCANTSVLENIVKRKGKIVHILSKDKGYEADYWIIDVDPNFYEKGGYSTSNETTLVPCNLNEKYLVNGMKVVVSGERLNCCNLLTHPQLRYSWGCKFNVIAVEALPKDE